MERLTGLARASVAVGLWEAFGFKSDRMKFLAKGVGLSKVVKITQILKNRTFRWYILPISIMKFNFSGCCFVDKYFEVIRTERGISTKKDIGDDSDRNGYFENGELKIKYPVDHMSTGFPCPCFNRTSGATYPKLPAREWSCSSAECRCFALKLRSKISDHKKDFFGKTYIPKSTITISLSGSRVRYNIFSGLYC